MVEFCVRSPCAGCTALSVSRRAHTNVSSPLTHRICERDLSFGVKKCRACIRMRKKGKIRKGKRLSHSAYACNPCYSLLFLFSSPFFLVPFRSVPSASNEIHKQHICLNLMRIQCDCGHHQSEAWLLSLPHNQLGEIIIIIFHIHFCKRLNALIHLRVK